MTYAIITGCSHTAGVGIDSKDCYVSVLENHYKFTIKNWAMPGGCSIDVLMKIVAAVKESTKPTFVVAQWPNVFRKSLWINNDRYRQNINSCEESFRLLLKNGEKNFYEPWMHSIMIANLLCHLADIPLINIMLETLDHSYMDQLRVENIELHIDEKIPGRAWFFDSKASDNSHHSAWCHRQWAERLIGIIDEHTTR
jgi:hypothetical protein